MYKQKYGFPLKNYMSEQYFNRIKKFSVDKETPFLVIDTDIIKSKYTELKNQLPFANIYYAVKANPHPEVLSMLYEQGSNFDVATRFELDLLLSLNVSPDRVSYGNTIKKKNDIKYFFEKGVRIYATDSLDDVKNLAECAPGSKVFFRILTEGTGSDWPLSRKFGAHPDTIHSIIIKAKELGLEPYGISFHVGSQQRDIGQWDDAIARCKYLFEAAAEKGIKLKMINLGGGFPANYKDPTQSLDVYAEEIKRFLQEDFGNDLPEIFIEPGRSITADAGVIVSEIVLVSKKARNSLYRWVYFDVGLFGGLIETLNESIKFPIFFERQGDAEEVILAGPTCDGMDILYEQYKYKMPATTRAGDKVYILSTGAYTQSYSSVNFNGIPPLKAYILK